MPQRRLSDAGRGGRRPRRRSRVLAVALTLSATLGLVAATAATPSAATSAAKKAGSKAAKNTTPATGTEWLCKPRQADDPCAFSRTVTTVGPTGQTPGSLTAVPPSGQKFNCFYVYPTVSTEKTRNADLKIQAAETDAAIDQASLFSQVCTVWAPMYKQTTLADLKGLSADKDAATLITAGNTAYASMLAGWKQFLAHDQGRPFILIGHSQGAVLLIHLIATTIDTDPSLRSKLVVAILAGANLQVPATQTVGATFTHIPLCTTGTQTGCAIAWSTFPSEPPASSLFGRAGQGVSLLTGQTTATHQQVACVNPAELSGGGAVDLDPWFISLTQKLTPAVKTVWVSYPDLYSGSCQSQDGATWLQVTDLAGTADHRTVVTESAGATWGYHTWDINLVLGDLVQDVAGEEAAYSGTSNS